MLIRQPQPWEVDEHLATPEDIYWNRRRFMVSAAAAGAALLGACEAGSEVRPDAAGGLLADRYPFKRNEAYKISRPLTDEKINSTYNNFYEFGSHKKIFNNAAKLNKKIAAGPWEIRVDGEVEKPFTIAFEDLVRKMPLEERLYRHRCVEAWSMTVPWSGFPMRAFLSLAKPLSSAKYVRMETFLDPQTASGQRASWYPWPYVEGLTMAEAGNELAFLVTGVYGKPAAPQFGAPLRLAVPWKYGFKSIKSLVRFSFTRKRPVSFWENVQGSEYGFWANVNPKVPHKRWSQASERVLGTDQRIPTRLFNGYAGQVAHLYKGLEGEPLWR